MTSVKKPIIIALIAALPLELASVLIGLRFPEGLPSDASHIDHLLDYGVGLIHWPAKILSPLFHTLGDSRPAFWIMIVLISVIGYLDWAALVAALICGARFLYASTNRRKPDPLPPFMKQ